MRSSLIGGLSALVVISILACGIEPGPEPEERSDQGSTPVPAVDMESVPTGPITHMLEPAKVNLERANNSNGSPESNADLCMGSDPSTSRADPRRGVALRSGKPCIDLLILRVTVPGSGGPAALGWSPNFTNVMISQGQPGDRDRLFANVPTDGSAVSVSLDTIPNLLTGGDRVRLTFEASIKPRSEGSSLYEMTIAEVEVTPL